MNDSIVLTRYGSMFLDWNFKEWYGYNGKGILVHLEEEEHDR